MRPQIQVLESDTITQIIQEATEILEEIGIYVDNEAALEIFKESGISVNEKKRILIPQDLVQKCLKSVPHKLLLFDREGELAVTMEGDAICFDPGSAALTVLDPETRQIRKALTQDFVDFSKVVAQCDYVKAQSTAIICSDVPEEIADRYRLFLAFLYCKKPIVTGIFNKASFGFMKDLLVRVRGNERALQDKPLAIFDAAPSPPLQWSDPIAQSVVEAARAGIPSEFVSMPLTGATSPVTLLGTIVQHAAETLSGIVISQLCNRGAPIVWGGSPSGFDLRTGVPPMGAIETILIDIAYAEVGKSLNLPTHTYLGLSDAKVLDTQAGLETGMGALMAGLAGINMISGVGMLDFERAQSIEKLVVDNEICGMIYRFLAGISKRDEPMAKDLLADFILSDKHRSIMSHPHTRKWYRKELFFPGEIIDRDTLSEWRQKGQKSTRQRARDQVAKILAESPGVTARPELTKDLERMMLQDAKQFGLSKLPERR